MKTLNIFSVTTLLIILIGLGSCKKNFLDKDPLDQLSSEIFWNTEADAKLALTGCYSKMKGGFTGMFKMMLDGLSDNCHVQYSDFYFGIGDIAIGNVSPVTGGIITRAYTSCYSSIASFNYFMKNIDRVNMPENKKNEYKGEVRFLRAFNYFELVNTYGDVILYKESPETVDLAKIAKSSKADVLNFVNEDLDFAIANLPDNVYNGHVVKGTAKALKVRVLLSQQKWSEAASLAQEVISSGKFAISNDYAGLFKTSAQANNPEIMFSTAYLGADDNQGIEGIDVAYGWYNAVNPYQDLVDDYECIDGKPISESPLYNPANPYANRDPRLDLTMKLPGENWKDPTGATYVGEPSATPYQMEKYVDLSHAPFSYSKAPLMDNDVVHIRYANVLLMYAEAKNEQSGPDNSIYAALNAVRARPGVGMPQVDQLKYNTKELLRNYIRHEQRIEFALEGQRYFDLKRWNIAHIKLPTLTNPAGVPLVFLQKHYLLPFPQAEIDNNNKLQQNPGY
jgi:starch-binding outer membrane protein, SusD/RagB family